MSEEEVEIKIVDGIPCIVVKNCMIPKDRKPIRGGPAPFVFELYEFKPKDFTELQRKRTESWLERVLKDLEEWFKGL